MKRAPVSTETKEALEEQDVCHHCKFLFPPHLLSTCRFVSDRQSMPKSCEGEFDFGQELGTALLIQACRRDAPLRDSWPNTETVSLATRR
jgi:hypothetical protein